MSGYHIQGAVPIGSDAYVERPFKQRIRQNIFGENWVLLLGPRQHGKTTSLMHIRDQLREAGLVCVLVDLQAMSPCISYEEVLEWFAQRIARKMRSTITERPQGNEARQLEAWLDVVIPQGQEPVAIFIDEASAIPNAEWRNSFYGQIRAIANERAMANSEALAARLRFVFVGSFRPETLVNSLNSPFNVCERIETSDFVLEDALLLRQQVEGDGDDTFVRQAYDIVGGQPYLLQFILSRVRVADDPDKQDAFDNAIMELRSGHDHFQGVFSRVFAEAELTRLVSCMVRDGRIPNEPANPNYRYLQVLGIARRDGSHLVFRNQLYQEFARHSSQLMEDLDSHSFISPLIAPSQDAYSFVRSNELREITYSMTLGAVRAHNHGHFRLALAGFGSALEAMLIDWLSTLSPSDLANAVGAAQRNQQNRLTFGRRENSSQPDTWYLVNLIKVARQVNNQVRIIDPPEALREWRNLIHPAVACRDYIPERELAPESLTACGLLWSLRRDIATVI